MIERVCCCDCDRALWRSRALPLLPDQGWGKFEISTNKSLYLTVLTSPSLFFFFLRKFLYVYKITQSYVSFWNVRYIIYTLKCKKDSLVRRLWIDSVAYDFYRFFALLTNDDIEYEDTMWTIVEWIFANFWITIRKDIVGNDVERIIYTVSRIYLKLQNEKNKKENIPIIDHHLKSEKKNPRIIRSICKEETRIRILLHLPDDWPRQLSYPGRRQNYFFLSSNVSNGCRPQFHLEPRSFLCKLPPPQASTFRGFSSSKIYQG